MDRSLSEKGMDEELWLEFMEAQRTENYHTSGFQWGSLLYKMGNQAGLGKVREEAESPAPAAEPQVRL